MKKALSAVAAVIIMLSLSACALNEDKSVPDNSSSLECEHSFTEKNLSEVYLKASASCEAPATYYYSCICGEKGGYTFTDGEAVGHSYTQKITSSKYLHSKATADAAATYYFSCKCGKSGSAYFSYGSPATGSSEAVGEWISCNKTVYCLADCPLYAKAGGTSVCGNITVSATLKVVSTNGEWYEVDKSNVYSNCKAYIKCASVTENSTLATFMRLSSEDFPPEVIIKDVYKGAFLRSDIMGGVSGKVGCVTSSSGFTVVGMNKAKTYVSVYFSGTDTEGHPYNASKLYYVSLDEIEIVGAPEAWQ